MNQKSDAIYLKISVKWSTMSTHPAFSSNHTPQSAGRKLATLRAHHIRIVGVVGSNPIRSTKKKDTPQGVSFFLGFRRPKGGSTLR